MNKTASKQVRGLKLFRTPVFVSETSRATSKGTVQKLNLLLLNSYPYILKMFSSANSTALEVPKIEFYLSEKNFKQEKSLEKKI
jgi:hypothetical protein